VVVGVRKNFGELKGDGKGYIVLPDRYQAIKKAISMAMRGDVVLIAGKGHEDYQIVGNIRKDFDDRKVADEILNG
jgi:UDP-N-acetylmuramoyl-L-alanyl-D-glutamate--2,6-diaminopimelate ligase